MSGSRFLKALLSYPQTWVVVLLCVAFPAAFVSWFQPPFLLQLGVVGLAVILFLAWPLLFAGSAAFAQAYYRLPAEIDADDATQLDMLERDLERLGAPQGAEQLRKLRPLLANLRDVLNSRLNAGEVTFARYMGAAEQVYLSALDNLRDIDVALRSVQSIDAASIERQLAQLRTFSRASAAQQQQIDSLVERQDLIERQHRRVTELLTQNESALTGLLNAATAMANAETQAAASIDAETAMAELERLAARAGRYAVNAPIEASPTGSVA
jgi:hypothetical protein